MPVLGESFNRKCPNGEFNTKVKKLIAPNLTSLHDTAFAGCTLELICTPEDIKQQIIVNQESYE